jgi:hypothetical protein
MASIFLLPAVASRAVGLVRLPHGGVRLFQRRSLPMWGVSLCEDNSIARGSEAR